MSEGSFASLLCEEGCSSARSALPFASHAPHTSQSLPGGSPLALPAARSLLCCAVLCQALLGLPLSLLLLSLFSISISSSSASTTAAADVALCFERYTPTHPGH